MICSIHLLKIFYVTGALDFPENERMTIEFKEVDVTNALELLEAPELIGAHLVKKGDTGKGFIITTSGLLVLYTNTPLGTETFKTELLLLGLNSSFSLVTANVNSCTLPKKIVKGVKRLQSISRLPNYYVLKLAVLTKKKVERLRYHSTG